MTAWKDVVSSVAAAVGNTPEGHACILNFLKVLPEEVTEGRKINLTVCLGRSPTEAAGGLRRTEMQNMSLMRGY